jgi:hypothetical protein
MLTAYGLTLTAYVTMAKKRDKPPPDDGPDGAAEEIGRPPLGGPTNAGSIRVG